MEHAFLFPISLFRGSYHFFSTLISRFADVNLIFKSASYYPIRNPMFFIVVDRCNTLFAMYPFISFNISTLLFFNTSAFRTPNKIRFIDPPSFYLRPNPTGSLDSSLWGWKKRKGKIDRRCQICATWSSGDRECRRLLTREIGPLFGEIRTSSCHARLPDRTVDDAIHYPPGSSRNIVSII